MSKIVIRFLAVILGLFVAEKLLAGIVIGGLADAAIFALFLGVINILVRPILLFLTLPITILTLGIFIFILNACIFLIVDSFISGIELGGFLSALFASLIVSTVSWFIQKIT
jgi:putative membrane protein